LRYAWIGVDGAIGLSSYPRDTLDVNSQGKFGASWTFPTNLLVWRGDTGTGMPKILLAPLYHDLTLNTLGGGAGAIRYGDAGNPCLFVVEWDSLSRSGGDPGTENTFRIILNKCTGTIEYQYGELHLDGAADSMLVGVQDYPFNYASDPSHLLINRHGAPVETTPRAGLSMVITPRVITGIRETSPLPTAFALRQNYPNPFNPVTTIEYDLAERTTVQLRVFNVAGELVASLVNEAQGPGTHTVRFDGSGLASGVYLCRLEAGTFLQQQKLVLMK
jgi:hypothetical protein